MMKEGVMKASLGGTAASPSTEGRLTLLSVMWLATLAFLGVLGGVFGGLAGRPYQLVSPPHPVSCAIRDAC